MAKGIVIGLIIGALVVYMALSQNAPEQAQTGGNLSEAPEYVANKAVVETMYKAFMDEDMETASALVADSVKWTSPAYGSDLDGGTKDEWQALLQKALALRFMQERLIARAIFLELLMFKLDHGLQSLALGTFL